jgi:PQQ-like domain
MFFVKTHGFAWIVLTVLLMCAGGSASDYLETVPLPGNECLGAVASRSSGDILAAGVDYSNNDVLLLKVSSTGTILQTRRVSGPGVDEAQAIVNTSDGGAVVVGSTSSFGAGNTDGFLIKFRPSGTVAWKRTFGTSGNEHVVRVVETPDRGLLILADADHDPNLNDVVVARFNSTGRLIWRKVISAGTFDHPSDLQLTSDNGAVVVMASDLPTGIRSVIVKLSSNGTIQWSRVYGSSGDHAGLSVVQNADDQYYFTELYTPPGSQIARTVLSKLNPSGVPLWSRIYQSPGASLHASVSSIGTSGLLLLTGNTTSGGTQSNGILIGLNATGNILWRKRVKPDNRPVFLGNPVVLSTDDSIVLAGCAGQRTTNNMDILLLKMRGNGTMAGGCSRITSFPLTTARFNLTSLPISVQEIPVPFLSGQAGFQLTIGSASPLIVCSAE